MAQHNSRSRVDLYWWLCFSLRTSQNRKMLSVANAFSLLDLDAEDDGEKEVPTHDRLSAATDGKDKPPGSGQNKKKNKPAQNESAAGKVEANQGGSPLLSEKFEMPLVWIDLEMSGLNLEIDRILEIACIITDGNLSKSIEGPNLVIHQTKECLDNMGEWCKEHHAASGLSKRVLQSTITEQEAEKQMIEFVSKHVDMSQYTPLLAGNSVYVDFSFLKKYMPKLAGLFNHVLVDVSSVKALCIRWFPRDKKKAPQKEKKHRALDDIRESIQELKYFKENIFKPRSKK